MKFLKKSEDFYGHRYKFVEREFVEKRPDRQSGERKKHQKMKRRIASCNRVTPVANWRNWVTTGVFCHLS